ncbi:MAG: thrombospondin type 3 repeat-containing protein [Candidatus Kuenenbacteria bacterium]
MKKTLTTIVLILLATFITAGTAFAANSITNRLKGRLLLQVQDKGRIWYVDPIGEQKHEVTFKNALNLFQSLSLGITNADLNQIPLNPDSVSNDVDTDNDGFSDKTEVINGYNPEVASTSNNRGNDKVKINNGLINRLKGRLLLQVQDRGRIWYIDNNGKRWEITWGNLMNRFRKLALGITDSDLATVGNVETANWQTYVNSKYGFEIKYPVDWYLYEEINNIRVQPEKDIPGSIPGPSSEAFEVVIMENIDNLDLAEFVKQDWQKAGAKYSQEEITISGINGLKVEQQEEAIDPTPYVYLSVGDQVYKLKRNLGDLDNFNQILSTFKFIN